ncbi:Hypothetical predicted protein [Mytilus galloprovincialis]|uniref:Uncharacterized protein n=1 Tax=Mytilus galloprovincialis TaxID=29158 RepID=A0A8B6GM32_MYTGA|nr:Hypothetical predicted protein [Mytilus galloprovincialis]
MINSPTQEVIEAERKERKQVFKSFIIIGCLEAIFSISLLICGISGAVYGKSDYYAGAFIAGGFFPLKGIYFINFYMKGISSKTDDNVVLSQLLSYNDDWFHGLHCWDRTYLCIGSFFKLSTSVFSNSNIACDADIGKYRSVAIPILVFVLLCLGLNIYTVYYVCKNQYRFGRENFPSGRRTFRQMLGENMAAQEEAGYQVDQNYSGVIMGTSPYAGPAYSMGPNPSGYPMGPTEGYPIGPTTSYPIGPISGDSKGPTTGYSMGPGISPPEQQFPGPYPAPSAPYSSPSDVKIDLNQPPEEPSAPPPSYESLTKH